MPFKYKRSCFVVVAFPNPLITTIETARLFKLEYLEWKEKHILIHGQLADYTLHLGSGIVHKLPGQALNIMAATAPEGGRIFLLLVDEDPKTAEILSKLLLLAKDNVIKGASIVPFITS